jgi:hypothetical protein
MNSSTLFGAPTRLDVHTTHLWVRLLTKNWQALMGRSPVLLESDLDAMAPLFANGASIQNLRARVYELPEADAETRRLPREVALIIDGCALITPEGRILLDVLQDLERTGAQEISIDRQLSALAASTNLRIEWHARWIQKQFHSSISAPVLGAALFLLINGSVGKSHALLVPSDSERDRELGAVVLPLIADFSESLGKSRPETDAGIRHHWAFTQLSRLLGRDVARETVAGGTAIFVRNGRERNLLEELAVRLERATDSHRRYTAIMEFIDKYRAARGALAAFNQMNEDPTITRRIADRLLISGDMS